MALADVFDSTSFGTTGALALLGLTAHHVDPCSERWAAAVALVGLRRLD